MPKDRTANVLAGTIWPNNPTEPVFSPAEHPIGRILVDAGRLSASDAQRVLEASAQARLPFGEAGQRLGLLKREDVDFALARQFAFPYFAKGDEALSGDVLAAYSADHPAVEQLRGLRSQIRLLPSDSKRANPMVAVVSSDRGDGRSFVAANLAVLFAQMGIRTLLIDADLRNPSQHRYFKLDNRLGLSTILAKRASTEVVRVVASLPELYLLTSGPVPPNPLELLERPILNLVLDGADASFEAVVIDTPAGEQGADAQLIGARAGSSILVTRARHTRAASSARFAQALTDAKAHLLGVVFNEY